MHDASSAEHARPRHDDAIIAALRVRERQQIRE